MSSCLRFLNLFLHLFQSWALLIKTCFLFVVQNLFQPLFFKFRVIGYSIAHNWWCLSGLWRSHLSSLVVCKFSPVESAEQTSFSLLFLTLFFIFGNLTVKCHGRELFPFMLFGVPWIFRLICFLFQTLEVLCHHSLSMFYVSFLSIIFCVMQIIWFSFPSLSLSYICLMLDFWLYMVTWIFLNIDFCTTLKA